MFAQQQHQLQAHLQARMENEDRWRQSLARRTISYVESDLQHILKQSPFLQHSQPGEHIAVFHRSEIITGPRLGKGGFSNVFSVAGFRLNPYYGQQLDEQQQQLRLYYQQSVATGEGRFAIKFLQEKLMKDSESFQCAASDLAVDAAYMSSLNHPNILPVRGLPIDGLHALADGSHDGYFIIMDRLEETLDDRLERWKHQDVSLQEKVEYALQLAAALQYLHERRIVYRDLKPHNVGFNRHGHVQLFDFGLCRELPSGDFEALYEMSGVGTRRYMATEVVNTARYNHKADVYSWSMVFWEMLYLDRPFPHYSIEEHQMMVCENGERPPLPHGWPIEIRKLLVRSWTASVKNRLSMRDAGLTLETYLNMIKRQPAPESPIAVHDRTLLGLDSSSLRCHQMPMAPNLQVSGSSVDRFVGSHGMPISTGDLYHQHGQTMQYDSHPMNTVGSRTVGEGMEVVPDYNSSPFSRKHFAMRNAYADPSHFNSF